MRAIPQLFYKFDSYKKVCARFFDENIKGRLIDMSRMFFNNNNRPTGILNSTWFNNLSFRQREEVAFDKKTYNDLDAVDRAQLSGYAHAIQERKRAENYKYRMSHPNYRRKTAIKGTATRKMTTRTRKAKA